ncbi:MAG: D-alanine--D-alanine ligase [Desulfobacteraceae bacterium 4572_130]|nr:MAG: D-alanine--D-alanine ligase [Desulfobacteraceae bacterium 4572_130]
MEKLRLALLSGGISSEREVSLNSGSQVYEFLDKNKYEITRYDPKTDLEKLVTHAANIDVALLILHGPYGEDGTIQGLLELLGIPYQGAGVLGSSLAMNKLASKKMYTQAEIPTPEFLDFTKNDNIDVATCVEKLGLPLVVKPVCAGSSIGMTIVKQESEFEKAIKLAFRHDDFILLEQYIKGIELTCGVLGNKNLISLPVIEIIPNKNYDFFDYKAKYIKGATQEICPARIKDKIKNKVQEYALDAHKALFLKGYSRTDMILFNEEIYVLETNTIPGMTKTSLYPQAAEKAGFSFSKLLDKLIALAMEK